MPASSAASWSSSWAAHGRALSSSQPGWSPREVGLGRGLDPVGAVAEVDRVEVVAQDPLLGPLARELVGQRGLAQLHEQRAVVLGGERVLDELLRDRRAALHHALVDDVLPQGAADAAQVVALVGVEAAVLDRDDRLLHHAARSGPRRRTAGAGCRSAGRSRRRWRRGSRSCRAAGPPSAAGRRRRPSSSRTRSRPRPARRGPPAARPRAACGCAPGGAARRRRRRRSRGAGGAAAGAGSSLRRRSRRCPFGAPSPFRAAGSEVRSESLMRRCGTRLERPPDRPFPARRERSWRGKADRAGGPGPRSARH